MIVLQYDPALTDVLNNGFTCVAKKAPTLGQILSPSLFINKSSSQKTWLNQKGSFKCGHTRCICCTVMDITNQIISYSNQSKFNVKQYINCNTHNIIYLVSCDQCKLQYVGHTTQSLKSRIRKHISDIPHSHTRNISALSQHFASVHNNSFSHMKVQGIERVYLPPRGGDFKQKLLNRETLWMFQLGSVYPGGLNKRLDLILHY